MKILLIQSYLEKEDLKVYPLGLVYLASCINGHDLRICDLNLYKDPYVKLEKELLEYNPNVVGISLRNIDNQDRANMVYYYKDFTAIIIKIKAVKPDILLVVGGAGYSMFAREIMERNAQLDFGVYLEGEETFQELLSNLDNPESVKGLYYRQNGEIKFTGKRRLPDMDNLPPLQRGYVDMSLYPSVVTSIGVESKRGCAFDCIYCNYPFLNGKRIRLRKPEKVVDEIEQMVNVQGINKFTFVDPIFNVPLDHASKICREIIRRNIKVNWGAYMHIRYATKDFLLLARDSGCTNFIFSPDGMSDNVLRSLGKGITEDEIKNIYRFFKTKKGIKDAFVLFTLMLNTPGESFHSLFKTLWFHVWTKYSLRRRGGTIISWIRIEPDTEIHKIALANGALKPDVMLLPETSEKLQDTFYIHPPLKNLAFILITLLKTIGQIKKIIPNFVKKCKGILHDC
jgi:putative variant cofactor biosynthesis B12-binding/radical SAM domain protein 1